MPKPTDLTVGFGLLPASAVVRKSMGPVLPRPATAVIRPRLLYVGQPELTAGRLTPMTNVMPGQPPNINVKP